MDFQAVVDARRMVRNYTDHPVDPTIVQPVLHNALHSPSAGFSQAWAFLLLDSPPDTDRFWAAATPDDMGGNPWAEGMRRAPVIVVPMSCKRAYLDRYAAP